MKPFVRITGIFLANGLTLFRLALAFYLPFAPSEQILGIIVLALFSEFFDGQVARWFHAETTFGRLMDPVADKAFILAALFSFMLRQSLSFWQMLLVASRDLLIIYAMCIGLLTQKWQRIKKLNPRWPGKVATAMQFAFLLNIYIQIVPQPYSLDLMFWATAASSLWAAWDYYKIYRNREV